MSDPRPDPTVHTVPDAAPPDGLRTTVSPLTRRRFLAWSGVAAAGLAVGATQVPWSSLLSDAVHAPLPPGQGVLVLVTLYGGNDRVLKYHKPQFEEYHRVARDAKLDESPHSEALPSGNGYW